MSAEGSLIFILLLGHASHVTDMYCLQPIFGPLRLQNPQKGRVSHTLSYVGTRQSDIHIAYSLCIVDNEKVLLAADFWGFSII